MCFLLLRNCVWELVYIMNYFGPKMDKVETKKSSLLFKLERKTKHGDKVNQ